MPDTELIKKAVGLACRAPSLHNSQPWQWQFGGGELRLFVDPNRSMLGDPSGREVLISCGAVLDHLRVAMAAAGWQTVVDRFPDPNDPTHLASIGFTPIDVTEVFRRRADAILLRRTDRLPFASPTDWELLEPALRNVIGAGAVHLDVISDDARPQLVEASRLAESLRLYDSSYHDEIDWWTGSFEAAEGIPYSSLPSEAESHRVDIERVFPRPHHSERRLEISKDHATILVLSTDDDGRTAALATGEALSAVLLECTMAGLATCPVTHVTEVRASRELVATLLDREALPQVLVRVGVVPTHEEVPPPTPRRPLDEVLHIEN
ncbi:Acg family FMN-binding oxidoreductase [Mycobacterium botniense]|uniref:Putative NAD(P)H nitroreductase acg n=1 Tax=Mycobacterium botniense TaxID=84962 RepID=A0A7I9XV37_9MYCO|nr:nitroreductase family protein [Mycobacterium botniense]GFG73267.1 putative NAD(P)H nitroreductase acg [Mycobacterium botniense]